MFIHLCSKNIPNYGQQCTHVCFTIFFHFIYGFESRTNFNTFGNSINNEWLCCTFMIKIISLMISILIFNATFKSLEDNVSVEVTANHDLIT